MNREEIRKRIIELRGKVEEEQLKPGPFAGYLPYIVQLLQQMYDNLDAGRERRKWISGGLGRLVTEDYEFSEGWLGQALLELGHAYADLD